MNLKSGIHKQSATDPTPPLWLGTALALGAYIMWAMFPLYFKLIAHIPPLEVLAQRTIWAFVCVLLIMIAMGRFEIFSKNFYSLKLVKIMALSGLTLSVNWGVFIVAVSENQVLQASLGYFTAPFMSTLLGIFVLGERPRPAQWLALAIALAGVVYMVGGAQGVPWLALALAVSWGLYGLLRKLAPLGSIAGLYMETLILCPIALLYVFYLASGNGPGGVEHGFFATNTEDTLLLVGVGIVTAAPLLLFARATRILALGTIGILQYLVPSGQFLLAVYVFNEPFGTNQLITFACIWVALAIYVASALMKKPN